MGPAGRLLRPTSSLPLLRQLDKIPEEQILAALDNLYSLYYPVPIPQSAVISQTSRPYRLSTRFAPLTDSGYNSGYTSEDEDGKDGDGRMPGPGGPGKRENDVAAIRADEFERTFATAWLKSFIIRAEVEVLCFSSETIWQDTVEKAAELLTALLVYPGQDEEEDQELVDDNFCREFTFDVPAQSNDNSVGDVDTTISVRLNDGLAGSRSEDHTDVGLQTWGAAIVFCRLLCYSPSRFGLTQACFGMSPWIVELGAGTGLVSLVLGKLLQHIGVTKRVLATDYHPAVVSNLLNNIEANYSSELESTSPVEACLLDWSQTTIDPIWPLGSDPAQILVATDVIYAPGHAAMLYECASRLLAPYGVFWLLATVRQNGRFNGVSETVNAVFSGDDRPRSPHTGKMLAILGTEKLDKHEGIGRGDENFYKLFRIGWA